MKMLDFVLVAVIFCINAARLFWKRDVGRYRSRFQNRHKKKTLTNQRRSADVSPTIWKYEMLSANSNQFLSKTFGGKP